MLFMLMAECSDAEYLHQDLLAQPSPDHER